MSETRTSLRSERSQAKKSSATRLDIQGLRALAVVLVILNHVLLIPTAGFIGVDVFFVISGFIITALLLREYDKSKTISFKDFYARRIKRILPASLLVLVTTFGAATLLLPTDRAQSVGGDTLWATLFGANWRMMATNVDYFTEGLTPSPLQHYWSLSIEEQFYFVWPWIMLAALLHVRRKYRVPGLAKRVLIWVISAIVVVSLAWSVFETITSPASAYFSSFTRFWELGVGALAAVVMSVYGRALPARIGMATSWLGLGIIIASALALSEATPFPGYAALLPVAGATLIMVGGFGASPTYSRVLAPLTNPVAVYIGNLSYSLYLWHFPLTILLLSVLPVGPTYYVAVLGGTLALSVLTYHFVENPIRNASWPNRYGVPAKRWRTAVLAVGAVAAVILVLSSSLTLREQGAVEAAAIAEELRLDGVAKKALAEDSADQEAALALAADQECRGAGSLDPANTGCDVKSLTLRPTVSGLQSDIGSAADLACRRGENDAPVTCTIGSAEPDALKVALIGDSHAGMYLPAIREIADEQNWSVTTYIGWGCQWGGPRATDGCGPQIELANTDFTDGSPYDVILSAASRKTTSSWNDAQVERAASMIRAAIDAGNSVVYLEDVPIPSDESLLCLQRPGLNSLVNDCATSYSKGTAAEDKLARAVASVRDAHLVSLNDRICTGDICPAIVGQTITFRDTAGHLSVTYAKSLKPYLQQLVLNALN
ncbi:SGNH hydrolase domain-containing protein [Leifsonia kafniensis]|uniref:SGNH hydrolase domain-containing protein n=1 Tax=Leifsonia kafniensis TaxID=475957 RepID=A0ABP7L874_9MICO